jgi:hypothetical protein
MNKDIIITCDTCRFKVEGKFACSINDDPPTFKVKRDCLQITDRHYVHPKYPSLKKRYTTYKYTNWEPKIENFFILTDEDFQL